MTGLPSLLDPELLYLFVIGPGFGECLLLRVPPDRWLIIDSFKCAKQPAAAFILRKYGGVVDTIVLTHPHADHYPGILELLNLFPEAVIACVHPQAPESGFLGGLSADPDKALRQRAKPTYDRIWQTWELRPELRWETFRSAERRVGQANLRSLHPARPLRPSDWGSDQNTLSSAIIVDWYKVRLLLGADVPNTHWPDIALAFPDLGRHQLLKVPHHGSKESIHDCFGLGDENRCWVVTPFKSKRLPRHEKDHGLEIGLGHVCNIHVTSLPFRHASEHETPCVTTCEQLRDKSGPVPSGILDEDILATSGALNRHVVTAFQADGSLRMLHHGPGSVLVGR